MGSGCACQHLGEPERTKPESYLSLGCPRKRGLGEAGAASLPGGGGPRPQGGEGRDEGVQGVGNELCPLWGH